MQVSTPPGESHYEVTWNYYLNNFPASPLCVQLWSSCVQLHQMTKWMMPWVSSMS